MKNCYTMLNSLIEDYLKIDGVIFYSIEMLPNDKTFLYNLMNTFIFKKKIIYFALEEIKVSTKKDIKKVIELLLIKKFSMKKKILKV